MPDVKTDDILINQHIKIPGILWLFFNESDW